MTRHWMLKRSKPLLRSLAKADRAVTSVYPGSSVSMRKYTAALLEYPFTVTSLPSKLSRSK